MFILCVIKSSIVTNQLKALDPLQWYCLFFENSEHNVFALGTK